MYVVERLIKHVYAFCADWPSSHLDSRGTVVNAPLPTEPFLQMPYQHAMSRHGSDKPDIRINALVSLEIPTLASWTTLTSRSSKLMMLFLPSSVECSLRSQIQLSKPLSFDLMLLQRMFKGLSGRSWTRLKPNHSDRTLMVHLDFVFLTPCSHLRVSRPLALREQTN